MKITMVSVLASFTFTIMGASSRSVCFVLKILASVTFTMFSRIKILFVIIATSSLGERST